MFKNTLKKIIQKKFIFTMENFMSDKAKITIKQGNTEMIQQGKAKIYTKYINKNQQGKFVENQVFYNPIQIFNRDLTILTMQNYINLLKQEKKQKFNGVKIVDALSASGLRTIRFLKQLSDIKQVYANDISEASHKLMKDNFQLNKLETQKIKMTLEDANKLLYESKINNAFDIIDLDPYGSVVPFLESAISSISDGGLLCATCTDTRVTCGPDFHKCYYYYGTTRAKVQAFQENALRIVLNTINTIANKHCRYIQPMISFQTEFYLRVFLRIHRGKTQCAQSGLKVGTVYNCNSCGNYQYQTFFVEKEKGRLVPAKLSVSSTKCTICQQPYFINGPIWLDNINNLSFAERMFQYLDNKQYNMQLKTKKKIYGMLYAMINQKDISKIPLGINIEKLCKSIKASTPNKLVIMAALQKLGYRLVGSYIHEGIFKTNANFSVLYDILKSWKIKLNGEDKLLLNIKQEYSLKILQKEIKIKPDFEYELQEKILYVPQFFPHQQKNMGPKGKALKRLLQHDQQMKQVQKTDKKKRIVQKKAQKMEERQSKQKVQNFEKVQKVAKYSGKQKNK